MEKQDLDFEQIRSTDDVGISSQRFDVVDLLSTRLPRPTSTDDRLALATFEEPRRSYAVDRVDDDVPPPQGSGAGKAGRDNAGSGKPGEDGGASVKGSEREPPPEGRLRFNPAGRIGRLERVERALPPIEGEQFGRKSLPDYDGTTREASHPYNVPGLDGLANGVSGKITHTNWDGSKVEANVTRGGGMQVIEYDQPAQVALINGGKEAGHCVPFIDAKRIETTVDENGRMSTVITTARGDRYIQTHDEKGTPSAIQDIESGTVHEGLRGQPIPAVVYRSN